MDFSRMASESKDLDSLVQVAAVQAARGVGIRRSKIMRYRPESFDLLTVAGMGWKPGVIGCVTLGTDMASVPCRIFQTRESLVVDDLPNDPEYRYPPVLRDHGIVSAMNAPVAFDGEVWGVIEVDSDVPQHFSRDDVTFLSTMGNIIGGHLMGAAAENRALTEAAKAVAEQKVLTEELLHRDKNDFQMILAILLIATPKVPEESRSVFRNLMDRIAAISMAHDQLSRREHKGSLEAAGYLAALCGNLANRREDIAIATDLQRCVLPHQRAVSLGLVVAEAVTNALKHVFPGRPGTIRVTLRVDEDLGEGCLAVSDDGVSMGPPRPGSSGQTIMDSVARQIGGVIERETSPCGTTVKITFPIVR